MTENDYAEHYIAKDDYFDKVIEALGLYDDERIKAIDIRGSHGSPELFKDSDFDWRGHFVKVKIHTNSSDEEWFPDETWLWPITDRGLAFIGALSVNERTLFHALEEEGHSGEITVAKTSNEGRVQPPIEKTQDPDQEVHDHYESSFISTCLPPDSDS